MRVLFFAVILLHSFLASAFETPAKQAIILDVETGKVLYEKNGYEKMFPSSMSKLMTAYIVFDKIKGGTLRLEDQFRTSEKAWSLRGSSMFLPVGRFVAVDDLLKGLIVQSGNDAAVVLAEGIAGGEEEFSAMMNDYGRKMGLQNSNFVNATGWPDPMHYTTCYDLAVIALRTIQDFPELYSYYKIPEFTYNDIKQYNRNTLVTVNPLIDGLKTGHTDIAGFGVVISGQKQGRRLIVVVNGLPSEKQRSLEAERLFHYGLLNYQNIVFAKANKPIAEVPIYSNNNKKVFLASKEDLVENIPASLASKVKILVRTNTPLMAPINKDTPIGEIVLFVDGHETKKASLYAQDEVAPLSFYDRLMLNIRQFLSSKDNK